MRSWTTLAARRGAGRHRRLVVLVLVVQLTAVALGSAFPALLAAAELHGVRAALATSSDTGLTVIADRPVGSVTTTVAGATRAADRLLQAAARTSRTVSDVSVPGKATGPDARAEPYLGELPGAPITVTAGTWPVSAAEVGVVPIAVPQAAATALGASLGSTLPLRIDGEPVVGHVVALYRAVGTTGPAWAVDPLSGAGNDPGYVDPFDPYAPPVGLAGPLLVAPGTLDRAGITPSRVNVAFAPDFSATTVDALQGLDARLVTIEQDLPVDTGRIAETVTPQTVLGGVVDGVLAQLMITRTTAAVAGLLLVVLAMVVLAQAAVLLDAARADERALLAARGASRAQLVGLAAWEAAAMAVVDVVLGIPLGAVVASLVRGTVVLPPGDSWLAGAAIALLVVAVRLLPRLRPAERTAGRLRRGTGIMRSGADLVLLVVAALLGWQLVVRRIDTAAGVDPVLVVAPAVLVLAGALVALRLVPLVGRLGEVVARRARGAVAALVGWELSRRASRATATVLLVSLAIGTGVFGSVAEATWVRSQLDQAQLAVGAPVRVPADPGAPARQASRLASGATGSAQPAIRRVASVQPYLGDTVDASEDDALSDAVVLGLTGPARSMLDRGRLAEEGGATIARLRSTAPPISGVAVPATALQLTVRVGDAAHRIVGAAAALEAVLEGADGLLSTVDLGAAKVDGKPRVLTGTVPATGMRLVGLQLQVVAVDPITYAGSTATTLPLRIVRITAGGTTVAAPSGWTSIGADGELQHGLAIHLAADLRQNPAAAAVVGWKPVTSLRGIWTRHLVAVLHAAPGGRFALAFGDVLVPTDIAGIVDRVPGSGAAPASAPEPDVAVVDQRSLSMMLVQAGDPLPQADEWWVDVAPDRVGAYLAAHAHAAGGAGADGAAAIAARLTTGPLRIATTQTLLLLVVAAVALGLLGFGVDVVASLDARRREMAQLRAIGLRRGVLERMLTAESTARVAIGAVLGLALGLLLGTVAAPHLVVGPDGGAPVPPPLVVLPAVPLLLLVVGTVVASLAASLLITRTFRGLDPATILREGEG